MVQENDGIARECRPSACKGDTSVDLLYPLSLAAAPPLAPPPRLALALALARALSCSLSLDSGGPCERKRPAASLRVPKSNTGTTAPTLPPPKTAAPPSRKAAGRPEGKKKTPGSPFPRSEQTTQRETKHRSPSARPSSTPRTPSRPSSASSGARWARSPRSRSR